jgi:hypothetical protein
MSDLRHLMFKTTSDRMRSFVLCVALSLCFLGHFEPAAAQAPPVQQNPSTLSVGQNASIAPAPIAGQTPSAAQTPPVPQAPTAPPLYPPEVGQLPNGSGAISFGQWLLSPTLSINTLYDSNLYSSPTPLSGPGVHIHPSLLAVLDTGIYKTSLYGSIDSIIYPTLDSQNNTFDRQAGFVQNYSPLRDLTFTAQGDYTHSTNAFAITNSLPNQLTSPASPGLPGAAGVFASQQTIVDPNDTFTGTATVYKEINRGFVQLSGSYANTQYEGSPSPNSGQFLTNFDRESYYGSGGYWFSPLCYAYADGIQAFTNPVLGPDSNSSRARAGIGSAPIGMFRGSIYAGWQGSEVTDAGTAGGEIYGGIISYIPTSFWNVDLSVDRLLNNSNITSTAPQAQSLGGLPFASVGVPLGESAQITSVTLSSNYAFSPQTSVFGVLSYTQIDFIGIPRVDDSWLASLGIRHRLTSNLLLTFDYQYTSYISVEPLTSFTRSLASVGAVYNF